MEELKQKVEQLADLNPCIRFIIDNFDALCLAHYGKCVLVVDERVFKVFDSMVEAMMYTDAIDMSSVPYALKVCDGREPYDNLTYSVACQSPN